MKFENEEMILDKEVRLKLIEEIEGPENIARKRESLRRYEILKDRIKKYILENLMLELDPATVKDMQSRIATVNIYKKVVDKKARVYNTVPKRELKDANGDQQQFDDFVDALRLNVKMKKANRYLEALLNTEVFVRPIKESHKKTQNGSNLWSYRAEPLPSYKYDAIEDANDPEKAMGYILSHFRTPDTRFDDNPQNRDRTGMVQNFRDGDGVEQTIANSPNDKNDKEYVWWGHKYHITFKSDGDIIPEKSGDELLNPIQTLPFGSIAKDRDGSFWAVGGDDLIEGSILLNTTLSDIYYIAKMQGMGLFYFFGKGVPKSVKVGPNQAVTLDVQEGDPTPDIGFATANPQLKEHMDLMEQYLAILLTTNGLEAGSVSGNLSATTASSGIQEMIIKSEPIGAIEDDQEIFRCIEPEIVNIAAKWHNLYLSRGLLREDLAEIGKMPDKIEYSIKFGALQQFTSEKEKLEIIEKRLDLRMSTMVDALILDNPDLSKEEAENKLKEVLKERMEIAKLALGEIIEGSEEEEGEEDANNEE